MKKILLSIVATLMFGFAAEAQVWSFGPKVGVSFSNVNGLEGARDRVGVTAGAFAEMPVSDWFAVQTELLYSMQGFEMKLPDDKTRYNLDYIVMPVVSKMYITDGLNLQLGGSFNYMVNAKLDQPDHDIKSINDMVNRFNAAIITGMAYDFDFGLVLEGRYSIGLVDTFRNVEDNANMRNGSLQFLAGWRF